MYLGSVVDDAHHPSQKKGNLQRRMLFPTYFPASIVPDWRRTFRREFSRLWKQEFQIIKKKKNCLSNYPSASFHH